MQTIRPALLAAVILFLLVACENKNTVAVPVISSTDSLQQKMETATAVVETWQSEIKLNGKVVPNESRQAKVFALVSGKISGATKELGDYVQKGQTLGSLRSTEVVSMHSDISLAAANVAMAEKNLESINELYKGDLATERELSTARLEHSKAVAEYNKAKQISSITGGKNATYVLSAPVSGFIIEKNITNNSEVRQDNDSPLFTIADLSTVWVMANVYERDINNIQVGDEVKVTTLADPDKIHKGAIDKIYNVLNPGTRTMQVRISMKNESYLLKPEMFATVKVKTRLQGQTVSVPYKAVVFENSRQYVLVKKEDSSLEKREVRLLKKADGKAFLQGLAEGENVVTSSTLFFLNAFNSN